MGTYENVRARKIEGSEKKKAYLIGGGVASLAAAFYLIRDGRFDGANITIFEELQVAGGSMDGTGTPEEGFLVRGGREMEEHYECTWDLFSQIPSLEDPDRTVLEDLRDINRFDPNEAACRLIQNRGEKITRTDLGLSLHHVNQLKRLFLTTEEDLGAKTVGDFFDPSFLQTDMWCYWRSMFAFQTWHSVVEMKRYVQRFIHLLPGMSRLRDILFSRYNQYESMILPLQRWLEARSVIFAYDARVLDLDVRIASDTKTVTGIHVARHGQTEHIATSPDDLVLVTNGSMTECSTVGNTNAPAVLNRKEGPCWTLWRNLAVKDPAFGRPEVFCDDIDETKWESFTITATSSKMADLLRRLTGRDPYSGRLVTGGIITVVDSSWLMSVTCHRQPHFTKQPPDTLVLWGYGLFPDNVGDYIKKKMSDCTGAEMLQELLCHLGAVDLMPDIVATSKVIPCMMPYITSQFMPRVKGDRPDVVPPGSTNLAFIGQFAEVPDDCVFTVEYSVRTAMMAVFTLLQLDKAPAEIYPSRYDVRAIAAATKTLFGEHLPGEGLIRHLLKDTSLAGLI